MVCLGRETNQISQTQTQHTLACRPGMVSASPDVPLTESRDEGGCRGRPTGETHVLACPALSTGVPVL